MQIEFMLRFIRFIYTVFFLDSTETNIYVSPAATIYTLIKYWAISTRCTVVQRKFRSFSNCRKPLERAYTLLHSNATFVRLSGRE